MTQVRCEVKGVFVAMSDATTIPVVLLTDGGQLSLPIFIGIWEAVSINSAKNKEILSRPFTHDLFLDLAAKFSITFHSLQIDSIEDGVYYAHSCSRPITTGSLLTAGPVTGSPLPSGQISLFLLTKTCLNPQARNFQISPRLWTCQHFCGNSAISAAFVIPASRPRDRYPAAQRATRR